MASFKQTKGPVFRFFFLSPVLNISLYCNAGIFNPLFEPFELYPSELIPRPSPQNTINYCGFIVVVVVRGGGICN